MTTIERNSKIYKTFVRIGLVLAIVGLLVVLVGCAALPQGTIIGKDKVEGVAWGSSYHYYIAVRLENGDVITVLAEYGDYLTAEVGQCMVVFSYNDNWLKSTDTCRQETK